MLTDIRLIISLCTRERGGFFYISNILHSVYDETSISTLDQGLSMYYAEQGRNVLVKTFYLTYGFYKKVEDSPV